MLRTKREFMDKAEEYVGTPFDHQGRTKGRRGRVDCIGLLLCIGEDLSLQDKNGADVTRTDYPHYPAQPVKPFVQSECRKRLIEKFAAPEPGDVVIFNVRIRQNEPGSICHIGIVTEINGGLAVIHASNSARERVVKHILDEKWTRRIEGVFTVPGLTD